MNRWALAVPALLTVLFVAVAAAQSVRQTQVPLALQFNSLESPNPSASPTAIASVTATASATFTATSTATPANTATAPAANTATATPTNTATPTPTAGPGGGVEVQLQDFFFTPKVLTVTVGQMVTWRNTGSFAHTSTSQQQTGPEGCCWDQTVSPGLTYQRTFTQTGTYSVLCRFHASFGMTSTIIVQPVAGSAVRSAAAPPASPPRPTVQDGLASLASVQPKDAGGVLVIDQLRFFRREVEAVLAGYLRQVAE